MKIIDKKTGKRVGTEDRELKDFNKKLKEDDPIIVNATKEVDDEGLSPMSPPDAYDPNRAVGIEYKDLHKKLQELSDEHKEAIEKCDVFEKALNEFKESGFFLSREVNAAFNEFFVHFDEHVLPHNRKEEGGLFPILHQKMLETGEHSDGANPHTPVDLMEDDHVKFIQLATLSFNFLGLAARLQDPASRAITCDVAYNNGKELVEMLRLHIYREDNTLFPLAQQLLTEDELNNI